MKYLVMLLLLFGFANAHSYLESSTPAEGSVLSEAATEIILNMTEAVLVKFSLFKVYKLETPEGLTFESDRLQINALAGGALEKLELDDKAERADNGVTTTEKESKTITIGLKENLEPGFYAVLWRTLSVDTHSTENFFVFQLQ